MRLKSLQMMGFKSFAEKTIISFESGFNALVGPNGCGKSNVVDAIKWVLGEKSARSIRGEKMEDVIFSGTDELKATSLAEVRLVFENQEGILPISGIEISITRRLYRDGESEYLINDRQVRLKEIEALFLDTGVGKHAYSVMEQGKIEQIVSTKPEDRRYIFEEAAGISRYKHQKRETIKKLEETSQNIKRIHDLLGEISRERDIKKRQSEKTRKYQELKQSLSLYEIKLYVLRARSLWEKSSKIDTRLAELTRQREELSAKVSAVNALIEEKDYKRNAIQLELFEQDKKLIGYQHSLQHIEDRLQRNRRLLQDSHRKILEVEKRIQERQENLNQIQEKVRSIEEDTVFLQDKLSSHEEHNRNRKALLHAKEERMQSARSQLQSNRQEIVQLDKESHQMESDLKAVIGRLVVALEQRKTELVAEEGHRQSIKNEIYSELDQLQRDTEQLFGLLSLAANPGENIFADARQILSHFNISALREKIIRFESFEDGFRSIFFEKGGIHSQKEEIQFSLSRNKDRKDFLLVQNQELEQELSALFDEQKLLQAEINQLQIDISKDKNELQWLHKQRQEYLRQLADIQNQIHQYHEEMNHIRSQTEEWTRESKEFEQQLLEFAGQEGRLKETIRELAEKREELSVDMEKFRRQIHRESEELKQIQPKILDFEKSLLEVKIKDEQVKEYLYNQYELDFQEAAEKAEEIVVADADIEKKVIEVKRDIDSLGTINHLALEELADLETRDSFYRTQLDDMEGARTDILNLLQDIDRESVSLFQKTFEDVRTSFIIIVKKLFEGGDADIFLTNPENPLESGIDITVQPPGKKPKHLSLLSGGEKSLIAIALLFAVYETKPSPFCFLDEIDAALDEGNVDRFIRMLKQFEVKTQFIVITHNKRTMSMAKTIYGVTMEKAGISKLVSMKLEQPA